MNAFALAEATP